MTPPTNRRRFLSAAIAGSTGLTGCSGRLSGTVLRGDQPSNSTAQLPSAVGLETVTDGLGAPVAVAFAPAADRRYVAQLDGRIFVHEADGRLDRPFLDLRDSIEPNDNPQDEQGLLGMALHPDFAENRRLYLRYSAPRQPWMRTDYTHRFVLAEFQATDDGRRVDPDSERTVLEIPEPRVLHNAGDIAFGPDGYLYIPVGDSGHPRYGQDVTETLLGSVLRIDVDEQPPGQAYAIPDDNPLVDEEGLDEYYAWGFRNPWRISFDDSDFFVANVGQADWEEVHLVEKGGNYGWPIKEGTHCFRAEECPDETSEDVRGGEPLVDPIIEYPHEGEGVTGISIIGGYVYRGEALSNLEGAYVFGDFLPEGRLFAAARPEDDAGLWPTTTLEIADGSDKLTRLLACGRDREGEVYVLGTGEDGGGLFRVVPAT